MTYYDVLGVAPDASPATIRQAYVALARRHHPDFHQADPAARVANQRAMQAVNEAWTVLSDPEARRRYDDHTIDDRRAARQAADDEARRAWRPFDEGDDEIDPRLLADEPSRVVVSRSRQMVMVLPGVSLVAGVVLVVLAFVWAMAPMAVLGGVAIVFSLALFLVLPLLELSASARNDRR